MFFPKGFNPASLLKDTFIFCSAVISNDSWLQIFQPNIKITFHPQAGDGNRIEILGNRDMPHPAKPVLSLLIVDDHAVVREGLEAMLAIDPHIGLIATAANLEETLAACELSLPDIVLLDLRMPFHDGFSILRDLHHRWPGLRIIILSASNSEAEMKLARRDGAFGFLNKSADRATLLATIHSVSRGWHVFPHEGLTSEKSEKLTVREFEILQYLGRGLTRSEIGMALGISEETVKSHLKRVFHKLKVTDQAEAVCRGFESGLLP